MAKDLYESRQMYQGPWLFYILIPIGMIVLFFAIDFGMKFYHEYTLKNDTKEILTILMERDDYTDIKEYAKKKYEEKGYETSDVSVITRGEEVILINYKSYFSMIGEIKGGKKNVAVARFKAYYNSNQELIVEEYTLEDEEEVVDDDPIIIPAT